MRVRYKTNLGTRDAAIYGLPYRDCVAESEHEYDEELAEKLIQSGFVSPVETKSPKKSAKTADDSKSTVNTVPPSVETTPAETEVKTSKSKND